MGMFTDSTNPYDIKSNTTSPLSILYCIYTGEGVGMFTDSYDIKSTLLVH